MSMKRALWGIFGLGVSGLAFSGYLTFQEYFATSADAACAPLGPAGSIWGYPPCVYGFAMYLAIVVLALWGIFSERRVDPAGTMSLSSSVQPKPS